MDHFVCITNNEGNDFGRQKKQVILLHLKILTAFQEYHLRNHMGSKPFHCKKCAYSCVNKSMLNSHMKSHTNIYQFRCRDCTYATKYCHSLKLHLRKYNHNRATDAIDSPVSIALSATVSTSNLCNGKYLPRFTTLFLNDWMNM